jgi:hypothetical protein
MGVDGGSKHGNVQLLNEAGTAPDFVENWLFLSEQVDEQSADG